MSERLKFAVDLPAYLGILKPWAKRIVDAAKGAEGFVAFARFFFERDQFDCRVTEGGKPVDGEFYSGPLYRMLSEGTEEDVAKGYMPEEPKFITPWARSIFLNEQKRPMLPGNTCDIDGHTVDDPAQMVFDALQQTFPIGLCTQAYIVGMYGLPSLERVAMFYPLAEYEDAYLLVLVSAYMGDKNYCLFHGDPEAWATEYCRPPRLGEPTEDYPSCIQVPEAMIGKGLDLMTGPIAMRDLTFNEDERGQRYLRWP